MSLIEDINDCSERGLIRIAGSIMKEGVLAKEADAGWPMGLAQRKTGELIIADYIFNIIWEIDSDGVLHRLAGTGMPGYSGDGGLAVDAELSGCHDLIIDNNGDILFSDLNNGVYRKIDSETGIITTFAGSGVVGRKGEGGLAVNASLNHPHGLALYGEDILLISDHFNHKIRAVKL